MIEQRRYAPPRVTRRRNIRSMDQGALPVPRRKECRQACALRRLDDADERIEIGLLFGQRQDGAEQTRELQGQFVA